jgi:RNA 2',3'-cyclic 3'-phosphodiesterase
MPGGCYQWHMRLFVAIAIAPGAVAELDEVVSPLRADWPELRWTQRDAWHLTLAFLGEVEEKTAGKLPARLARAAARHAQPALSLRGAGAFPSPGRARVVWSGIQGDRRGLGALAASVAAGAGRAGVAVATPGRDYQPHLTLARCRVPVDVRPLVDTLSGFQGTGWVAREIYLIRSHLGAQTRYETLGAWPLCEPGQAPLRCLL